MRKETFEEWNEDIKKSVYIGQNQFPTEIFTKSLFRLDQSVDTTHQMIGHLVTAINKSSDSADRGSTAMFRLTVVIGIFTGVEAFSVLASLFI